MSKKPLQNFFSTSFAATNQPGTCLWCGQNTRLTFVDLDSEVTHDSILFCSMACSSDFGENAALLGARLDPKTGGLFTISPSR